MSKPTLDGTNSKAIAHEEAVFTRAIADKLIQALSASKRGNKELTETLLVESLRDTADLDQIVDLMRQGRPDDALALISRKQLKGGNK